MTKSLVGTLIPSQHPGCSICLQWVSWIPFFPFLTLSLLALALTTIQLAVKFGRETVKEPSKSERQSAQQACKQFKNTSTVLVPSHPILLPKAKSSVDDIYKCFLLCWRPFPHLLYCTALQPCENKTENALNNTAAPVRQHSSQIAGENAWAQRNT